ncbi:TonB family protein [Caulobacter ginsengisoli]|uniref:TonB family protein n=1 Tax=Caulobacter ginsengisoli TaxID=400775 RepID=A0ABU0IQ28_9CAUL|nr:energy transducer TonB [Caulobacter ginsengisoli]MDQ0463273.1 TonB family protein [Caulobacter ginsengisoli]
MTLLAALVLMGPATAGAQAQTAEPAPARDSALGPAWIAAPTITDLKAVYPPQARQERVEGTVILSCKVTATGELQGCTVLKESSPGAGFGQAALKLVPKYRMNPRAADGSSMEGAQVALPVRFQITEEGPTPAPG